MNSATSFHDARSDATEALPQNLVSCLAGSSPFEIDADGLHVALEGLASPAVATLAWTGELMLHAAADGYTGNERVIRETAGLIHGLPTPGDESMPDLDILQRLIRDATSHRLVERGKIPESPSPARWIRGDGDEARALAQLWAQAADEAGPIRIVFFPACYGDELRATIAPPALKDPIPPFVNAILATWQVAGCHLDPWPGGAPALRSQWVPIRPSASFLVDGRDFLATEEALLLLRGRHPKQFG